MSKTIIRYVEEQIGQPVPIVTGTPDIRKIRKIEEEIFGEAMTLYPGDWREIAKESHWKNHARYSFDYAAPGCVWCEDHRQDRVRIKSEAEAKHAVQVADRRRSVRRTRLLYAAIVLASMTVFTLAPLIILAAL